MSPLITLDHDPRLMPLIEEYKPCLLSIRGVTEKTLPEVLDPALWSAWSHSYVLWVHDLS